MEGKVPLSGPHESYINRVKAGSGLYGGGGGAGSGGGGGGATPPSADNKHSQALLDIEKNRVLTLERDGESNTCHVKRRRLPSNRKRHGGDNSVMRLVSKFRVAVCVKRSHHRIVHTRSAFMISWTGLRQRVLQGFSLSHFVGNSRQQRD